MQGQKIVSARFLVNSCLSDDDMRYLTEIHSSIRVEKLQNYKTLISCKGEHAQIVNNFICDVKNFEVERRRTIDGISRNDFTVSVRIATHGNKLQKSEAFGIYLLELLSSPSERDAVIGDLLEVREIIRDRDGERRAKIYFWWQVTRSVLHFALSAFKRLWWVAGVLGFFGWVARQFSS